MRSLLLLTSVAIAVSPAPMGARTLQPYVLFDFAQAKAFFGAEFDRGTGRVTHIAFNGYA